jgi:hypothetical protein
MRKQTNTHHCNQSPHPNPQGSLREGLDRGLLKAPSSFLAPHIVLALAHDVAAAMLHLHSEGIVHGGCSLRGC